MEQTAEPQLESILGEAFGGEAPTLPAAAPEPPAEPQEAAPDEAPAEDAAPVEGGEQEEAAPEPAFEIEVDGAPETIQGADRIKEVLQRGIKAQRNHEENARVREALVAQAKQQQEAFQIQGALAQDITELRALDAQLEQWNRVDWSAAFDADAIQALKMREQRDQLREMRDNKYREVNVKHEQFTRSQKEATAQRVRAEHAALLSKVPEWRNQEKATAEKQAIVKDLTEFYGFTAQELESLDDHRMLLVARDGMKYRELLRTKLDKQVRTATPVAKPGAAGAKLNGKTEFTKVRAHVRQLGSKGNHKAQEDLMTSIFNRTFK